MTNPTNPELVEEMRWQLEKIRNKQAENAELLGKLDAAQTELAALEATATSPDRTVTVIAGSGGIVHSVELSDDAMSTNARTLAATITATIREAIAIATSKQLDIVRTRVDERVDPQQILGPQARLAGYRTQTEQTAGPADEEPMSESDQFLRNLGIRDH
ncbi:MAG: YbaB/EbfC family nucleoid-associated protein [Haloechinothrix sp.]